MESMVLHVVQLVIALGLVVFAANLLIIAWRMIFVMNHAVYARNRKATQLARRYNQGHVLTEAEQRTIDAFIAADVLEHKGLLVERRHTYKVVSPLHLTERALEQLWT